MATLAALLLALLPAFAGVQDAKGAKQDAKQDAKKEAKKEAKKDEKSDADERLLIQLKPRVAVTRSPVLLSDVAELHGPKTETDRFAKLEICPAPAAGKPRYVTPAGVRLAARLAGIALQPESLVGAAQVEIVASWTELSSDELIEQAQLWILAQAAELGDRMILERALKPDALPLLDGAGPAAFDFSFVSRSRTAGSVQVKITVRQGAMVVGERVASFRVRRFGKQMRLLTDVRRGEAIHPSQLLEVDGEWTTLGGTPVLAVSEVDGMVAARDLGAGLALTREQLEAPQLAERGDTIQLVMRSGTIEIVLMGTAQRAGRKGDVVPVLNPSTQKVISAQLVSRNAAGYAVAMVK
jgi:flagella basal body P-ring formation protein FlgA